MNKDAEFETCACPQCYETIKRTIKWMDHAGCSPKKAERYEKLLAYVKDQAYPDEDDPTWISKKHLGKKACKLLQKLGVMDDDQECKRDVD